MCETGQILGTQLNLTRGGNGLAAPAQALSVLQPIRHAPDRLESSLASRVFTHIPVKAHWPAVAMDRPFPKTEQAVKKVSAEPAPVLAQPQASWADQEDLAKSPFLGAGIG